jgi:hypothetical protein
MTIKDCQSSKPLSPSHPYSRAIHHRANQQSQLIFTMKFLLPLLFTATLVFANPNPMPNPNPFAEPVSEAHNLIKRKVCTRKLACGDRKGVCVDTSKASACVGGDLYKADCGSEGASYYCCLTGVSTDFR